MKFVRFGPLSLQKQVHYKEPSPDIWTSSPPRKKGFFAFPAGCVDPFYLPHCPPEDRRSKLQYIRDDEGNKITRRMLYDLDPADADDYEGVLSAKGEAALKKKKIKHQQIVWIDRPSWVMFFPDPKKDLTFYGLHTPEEDRSRLNQPLEFLLDPAGNKIKADEIFSYDFLCERFPANYEGGYQPPVDEDIFLEKSLPFWNWNMDYHGPFFTFGEWLKKKNVSMEQLCPWPCYAKHEDVYATMWKKYRVFEYEGSLWHHLGMFLKRSEILDQFAETWYYTDIYAYERALKKSLGKVFGKKLEYQRKMGRIGYRAAYEYSSAFDIETMYEVFFDRRIP